LEGTKLFIDSQWLFSSCATELFNCIIRVEQFQEYSSGVIGEDFHNWQLRNLHIRVVKKRTAQEWFFVVDSTLIFSLVIQTSLPHLNVLMLMRFGDRSAAAVNEVTWI
jgi:hypothetical protein